jgi:hypothetical protein
LRLGRAVKPGEDARQFGISWMQGESKLDMAERHVREAEVHVAHQQDILARLRRDGHPTLDAESLLNVFQETLKTHQDDLARLQAEQA